MTYKTYIHFISLDNFVLFLFFESCVTGSYDRTARIWDVESGSELSILQGHQNAIFTVQYNYPIW